MTKNARRIDCINTVMRNGRRHVARISGAAADGARWALEAPEALSQIESGEEAFFVEVQGESLLVTAAVDGNGEKCLRTVRGSLLDLPDCG